MKSAVQLKTAIPSLLTLAFLCLFLSGAQAVVPAPDGGYPNFTTAEGSKALQSLTTGAGNTGVGWYSLFTNSTASFNTGIGAGTLVLNNADSNTAVGAAALLLNTDGAHNTAVGVTALVHNQTGTFNTANGDGALFSNTTGSQNTAIGFEALYFNSISNFNTAIGFGALVNNTGSNNTALGLQAGLNSGEGSNNVYIGADMHGVADELDHTYIRNINTTSVNGAGTDTVTVNLQTGLLGHLSSSRRYKEDIKPMEKSSETLYRLNPVTYRYKKEIDSTQSPAFGLIAEEVAEVNPHLVARTADGQPESVHYEMVNAMLLNEFLKEHRAFLEEQRKVKKLEAALAAINQRLKEQEARIEKVSAQIEIAKPDAQMVSNKP